MKITYVSNLISKNAFSETFGYGESSPAQQAQRYNRLLAGGLAMHTGVDAVSQPSVVRGNNKKLFVKLPKDEENNVKFSYTKIINIPFIKNIVAEIDSFKLTEKSGGDAIVIDLLAISAAKGALRAAKKTGAKTVGIITDLPDFLPGRAGSKTFKKMFYSLAKKCDGFVLLTEQMAEYMSIKKPYVVIEGLVEENALPKEHKYDPRVVLYAGGLEEAYGVSDLTEAFKSIKNAELRLYGKGTLLPTIKEISKDYPNIKYMGILPNDEIIAEEKRATLLVNPRNPSGEFTKYSFPSKNMEYLSSGTPVLCHMLPGMPLEYNDYIYEIGPDLNKSLNEILAKDSEELYAFAENARNFVLENKNNRVQAEKIKIMIEKL